MRKIIQITATAGSDSLSRQHVWDCTALCDDGSLWLLKNFSEWERLPDIPQDEEIEEINTPSQNTDCTFMPDWDDIIRNRTPLRTRDGRKAFALSKQGDERDYPIRGITIVGDGGIDITTWTLSGDFYGHRFHPKDIVGYWEEETNSE